MNIVIVTESHCLASGGLSRSLRAQVAEFRRRGHQALIAAPHVQESPIQFNEPDIIEIPASNSPEASRFGAVSQWFSANSPVLDEFRPDVVHGHAPFMAGALAVRIASRYSVPLVFTIHRRSGLDAPYSQMPRTLTRRLSEELAIGYCRLADVVITPNDLLAAFVLDHEVENRVEIVPTGVDMDRLSRGNRSRLRQHHRVPDDAFTIGQSGRFDREGDLSDSLQFIHRFLHQHDGIHWFIACDVDLADSGIKQLRRSESLSARLHLIPAATADDVADFYASLDVFVDTAVREEESIELVEALAAGIPAIASCTPENRELIGDELCGRLLHSAGHRELNAAIESLREVPASTSRQVREAANRSVAPYGIDTCCERLLALYSQAIESVKRERPTIGDWHTLAQRISTERRLWRTRRRALGGALTRRRYASRVPVLRYAIAGWRILGRWTSRRAWSVRLLNLPVWETNADEPGLIVLQVDGLSRAHLERALDGGRLPFLRRLLRRESYRIHSLYSGLPSTTPAVLGELFYGVEQAVPAFGFRDHRTGSVVQMFQPGIASRVQQELSSRGLGLLSEGSAYSVIYSGGANESSFCPATTGWRNVEDAAMWRRLALYLLNLMSLARICVLSCLEFSVGAVNCVRGIWSGHDALRELLYIPRRVIINIVLRELLAISVEADATRGVPIIYANFLGYDENAHRRGPSAFFAYYALRGIDRALKRIWKAAHASERRSYEVWIISDHGQQRTLPYRTPEGRTIVAAVEDLYRSLRADQISPGDRAAREDERVELQRASWLYPSERARPPSASTAESHATDALPTTVAIGPLGYVYWPDPLEDDERAEIAVRIRDEAHVPLVMSVLNGTVWAWTKSGRYRLPDEMEHVLPQDHPFLDEVAQDLVRLCFHQDAGQFLISGWRNDGLPLSFVPENGAHGGPGPEEVHAFAVLPADAPMPEPDRQVLRPRGLRQLARATLGRLPPLPVRRRTKPTEIVRIATYNIHSGIGLDGRPSLRRIGRVLAKAAPDIVALQEVDVHHDRTDLAHQAEWIAEMLQMQVLFHPAFEIEAGQYGNAILSRFPMQLQRAGSLRSRRGSEPRAALWVQIEIGDKELQVVTTHLSLSSADRRQQIDELLGPGWLQDPRCKDPVALCGDLNLMPGSDVHRRLTSTLSDVQASATGQRPLRTWFGPLPLTRIDQMLVGQRIRVKQVQVPRDRLARTASDHLPLIVDLELLNFDDADESELQKDKRHSIKTHS